MFYRYILLGLSSLIEYFVCRNEFGKLHDDGLRMYSWGYFQGTGRIIMSCHIDKRYEWELHGEGLFSL